MFYVHSEGRSISKWNRMEIDTRRELELGVRGMKL